MPYKDQIKKFWHEYLNGTPLSRFNWLASGNPAGKTIVYLINSHLFQ